MTFSYVKPKKKAPHITFSLQSLRVVVTAIDPNAARLLLRYAKGSDLTPEEEAQAAELHRDAREAVWALLNHAGEANPLLVLALGLEKFRKDVTR